MLLFLGLALAALPPALGAQQPSDTLPGDAAPADTLPTDTVSTDTIPPDSIPGDTVPAVEPLPDFVQEGDTLAAADSLEVEVLPAAPPHPPAGWETGVWEWDREDLLATRATTLAELIQQIPGVIGLRGGDFGTPRAVSAYGAGGGGLRVFRDGIEVLPMEGSVPDLGRVGLAGVERVRVERNASGIRVDVHSLRIRDPRPYSLIQAGTGDLDTNLLRGVFVHPRAFGGNVGVSLERIDTQGPGRREPGAVTSFGAHYTYLRGDRFGVRADVSRSTSDRDTLYVPGRVNRTDWSVQGRWRPVEGVVAELFGSRSSIEADTTAAVEDFPFRNEGRGQWGARIAADRGPFAARVEHRFLQGEGLPGRALKADLTASRPDVGGVSGSWERDSWDSRATTTVGVRAWTAPLWGLSAFGSIEDFQRGVPSLPALPDDGSGEGEAGEDAAEEGESLMQEGPAGISEGRNTRIGGRFQWAGLELAGARLGLERDTVHPLGLPMDRDGGPLAAGRRTGWETTFRIPLLILDGLALEGSGQLWERAPGAWPYLPRRTWHGALSFHDTFYPTENLEVWFDVVVRGRDRMPVSLPAEPGPAIPPFDPAVVPFDQSWAVRLQIRVVTVRLFAGWENFTLRQENQDFPGRVLPATRATYGVRWTLWN